MKKVISMDGALLVQQSVVNTINLLRKHLVDQQDSEEFIHRIRVDIKHLRAWLRLLRKKNDVQNWKKIDQQLHELAKQLGSIRDTQAINKTFKVLRSYAKSNEERTAIDQIQKQQCLEPVASNINWADFERKLLETLNIFEQEFVSFKSTSILKKGLKHTIKKIKKTGEITYSKQGMHEDIHKLRKLVKTLGYQLAYSNKIFSVKPEFKRDISKLGNILGKAHDLLILRDKIKPQEITEFTEITYRLIDRYIALIIKNSSHDYKRIFNSSVENNIRKI